MQTLLKTLNSTSFKINDNITLNVLNIEEIDDNLKKYIDEVLIDIFSKGQDTNIIIVKKKLKDFFKNKGKNLEYGAIAEFFIHLYLKIKCFEQNCLYENLEENSIKKGFDGFYSKDNEIWIMESKSGHIKTKNISHINKIREAYNDLKNKVTGNSENNPWGNAYHHAFQARSEKDILKQIKFLEDRYTLGEYSNIEEHNIIPCSTLFYDCEDFSCINLEDLKEKITNYISNKNYKRIEFVCLNKKTKNLFLEYINN